MKAELDERDSSLARMTCLLCFQVEIGGQDDGREDFEPVERLLGGVEASKTTLRRLHHRC